LKKSPRAFRFQSMLTTPSSMSSASPFSNGSAIYKVKNHFRLTKLKVHSIEIERPKLDQIKLVAFFTMVILFFLLGVSAKHFIDEDSTTVSQNETTGSATYI
jgi:hypothetical protein